MSYDVRDAIAADATAIADIYNHYILESTVTFHIDPVTPEEREAWLSHHGESYPVVVAQCDGVVEGWGSLSPWGERPGWCHTVEISVYVAPDARGHGIGPLLTQHLLQRASLVGHHAVMSQIVSDNTASLAMAERAGFVRVGHMREVGRKFDRWLDVVLLEYLVA
ncbi:MAG: N-acetyltransferase family protein [Coriobacteriia bacterium]|nr:N-acetyltransferase family protein [Coriobacteriia bacterium]